MANSTATHNTLISLREYVDIRFDAQEKAVTAALAAADRAVGKAELASEKRFDSVNEFRAALSDSSRLLMPRSEAEQGMKSMEEKLNSLVKRVDARDERVVGADQSWIKIGLIASILVNFVMIFYYMSGKGH
jgi:hypothetical protein